MAIQTLLMFALFDVGFRFIGFPSIFRLVDRWGRRSVDVAPLATQRRVVPRVLKAVRTAARYYYRQRLDCLPRAMATYVLLRQGGVPATLRIGVKRYPFAAHAWVECLGEVIDGSPNNWQHEPYVPILSTREPVEPAVRG